jgi:hypothetical protein
MKLRGKTRVKCSGLWNEIYLIFEGEIRNLREKKERERIRLQNIQIILALV